MKPTVIIHYDKDSFQHVISDVPVTVITIDDRTPADRVYRHQDNDMGAEFIEALIGESAIGHAGDGSAAEARAHRLANGGKPALEIVK